MKAKDQDVRQLLRELAKTGTLTPWQQEEAERAVKKLLHARRKGDTKAMQKAAGDLARVFLKVCIDRDDSDAVDEN